MASIRRECSKATLIGAMLGVPLTILLIFLSSFILGMFEVAAPGARGVLTILLFSQCINVCTGPTGYLLTMTGHESSAQNVWLLVVPLTIIMSYLMTLNFGLIGTAWSVLFGSILLNVVLLQRIRKYLGFVPTPWIILSEIRDRR